MLYYLILVFLVGLIAELIDGGLGMGYGVASSSALISLGIVPALASASVHTAKIFTTLASGVSHLKFRNVNRGLVFALVPSGICGGILGAIVLVEFPTYLIKFAVSIVLLTLGIYILFFYALKKEIIFKPFKKLNARILGFFAAFIDAFAGGGWGPVSTTTIVACGDEPKKAIGSVNFSEFFVTIAIGIALILMIGFENVNWHFVVVLALAGSIMAPFAAYLCNRVNQRKLGIFVGILIIIVNLRTIFLLFTKVATTLFPS